MALGRVGVKVGIDGSGFYSGLRGMQAAMDGFSSRIRGQLLSLFGVGFVTRQIRDTIDWGSKISDLAVQTRLSTEEIQAFEYAALKTGSTLEQVINGFGLLGKARNDALRGLTTKQDAFTAIFGKNWKEQLTGQSIGQLFLSVAKRFREADFGAAEQGLLKEVLGRSAPTLIPAFKEGLDELFDEARTKGAIVRDETVQHLDKIKDAVELLKQKFREPLAEAISHVTTLLVKMVEEGERGMIMLANFIEVMKEQGVPEEIKMVHDFLTSKKQTVEGAREEAAQKAFARALKANLRGDAGEKLAGKGIIDEVIKRSAEMFAEMDRLREERMKKGVNWVEDMTQVDLGGEQKRGGPKSGDALAKIGGFVGASNRAITAQEKQLRVQESMLQLIRKGIATPF